MTLTLELVRASTDRLARWFQDCGAAGVAALVIAALLTVGPGADFIVSAASVHQASPGSSFDGHWVLTSMSPQRPAYDQFWFGTEVLIRQTETTLVITRVSPPPQREARFTFGAESHNEYIVNGQKLVRDSRATLSRETLLISTDTTPPEGQRWLSNILRWSLDPDGTLVVGDTEICGKGECPSVVTTLKFMRRRERNGASDDSASAVK